MTVTSSTHHDRAAAALAQAENALLGIYDHPADDALTAIAPALISISHQLAAITEQLASLRARPW